MAQLPEQVRTWLYSVLHEYHDPRRTYADVVHTISTFPSLRPRTEVYTYDNGSSALLLTLSGTLPVRFRDNLYDFPLKIWINKGYPQETPLAYIVPDKNMQTRPGQHIALDGRIYHPYLRDWFHMWHRANITELLQYLQHEFAKEPPVIARTAGPDHNLSDQASSINGAPQLPPKQREVLEMSGDPLPPPRPPKANGSQAGPSVSNHRDLQRDGPPLPPLPSQATHQRPQSAQLGPGSAPPRYQDAPPSAQVQRYAIQQPRLATRPTIEQPAYRRASNPPNAFDQSPVSPIAPSHNFTPTGHRQSSFPGAQPLQHNQGTMAMDYQAYQQQSALHTGLKHITPLQDARNKQVVRDLLSDPFEVALSAPTVPAAAPPIPPNPEKEHLLQALSAALVDQAQQKVFQNASAIAPLQAQQAALRAAHARLDAELTQLQALDRTLTSNEAILHRSIQECDRSIELAKTKKQPLIDEVLVAPTLLSQQLWTVVADEAACREAMYALQKAVDKGRVRGDDFVRQMRNLGRERFLKMALARKCAHGLGLDIVR